MRYWLLAILLVIIFGCNQPKQKSFVVTKVRAAAKLATTEVVLNKVVWAEYKEEKFFRNIFIKNRNNVVILNTEATVKLGVDLKKLSEEDVVIYPDSTVVILPPIEILNFSYPHENYEEVFPISNFDACKISNKVQKLDEMLRLAEKDIRSKLEYLKLEEQAEDKTKKMLSAFLNKSQFHNVIIKFEQ